MGTRLIGLVALSVGVYIIGPSVRFKIAIRRKSKLEALRKKFPYSVSNIAHRGGALLGPENTMYTFRKGVEEGFADMIELDVRESKDGQIVVSHDQSLARACGEPYEGVLICNFVVGPNPSETLPQSLRKIPLEFRTHDIHFYEAAADVPVDDTTRVCLLREVFDALPDVPLHVDIKDKGKDFVAKVLDLIAEYKRESTIFLGSSQPENEAHIRDYFKQRKAAVRKRYRIFPSVRGVLITHLLFYSGLLPLVPLDIDIFSIPIFTSTMRSTMIEEAGSVTARIAMFLLSSQTLWKYLQSRGVAVVGWVINDEVDFKEGIQLPINGLMSDDPRKLHNYLVSHKEASKLRLLGT